MKTVKRIYTGCALMGLNTLLIFLLLNLLAAGAYGVRSALKGEPRPARELFYPDGSPVDNGMRTREQLEWFDLHSDPTMKGERAAQVLDDFFVMARRAHVYHSWAQDSAAPYEGKQVHVDTGPLQFPVRRTVHPARRSAQRETVVVYVFGGSTTFGYWVADEQTWPSSLAQALNGTSADTYYAVVNFGGVGYTLSQEFAIFTWLLRNGQVPDVVVFMDGVNVFPHDVCQNSEKLRRATALVQGKDPEMERIIFWRVLERGLADYVPLFRVAQGLGRRRSNPKESPDPRRAPGGLPEALSVFRGNYRMLDAICRDYGVRALFCLQPNAFYNYPPELYRRKDLPQSFLDRRRSQREFYEAVAGDRGLLHLEHLFEDYGVPKGRKAVLDYCHYTPDFSGFLAEAVARRILDSGHTTVSPTRMEE